MDEAAEIEELLPWYEKGTLDPGEMRRVAAYLEAHPEMQARLVLIREELAETIAANEGLGRQTRKYLMIWLLI
jgi:anti-sigma factor RsiW